jgi:hypothetical protein
MSVKKLVARIIRGHGRFAVRLDAALRAAKDSGVALIALKKETGERCWNAVYAIVRKVGKTKLSDPELYRYKTIAQGWPILCRLAGSKTPAYTIRRAVELLSQEGAPPIISDPIPPAPTILKISPVKSGKPTGKPTGQIIHCEASAGMARLDAVSVPLTLTSPPFDGMRLFGGHKWDWQTFTRIADQLWRVTADGGVVCWNIMDQVIDGGYSLTSHRQAIYLQELGFKCHDLIVAKCNARPTNPHCTRYVPVQYVYVWSKGEVKTVNLLRDKPNKDAGVCRYTSRRSEAGVMKREAPHTTADFGVRSAVWEIPAGWHSSSRADAWTRVFPARMPEILAKWLIECYSVPGDLVLDPLCGIGTTCTAAKKLGRNWLGFDVWEEAADWAKERLRLLG